MISRHSILCGTALVTALAAASAAHAQTATEAPQSADTLTDGAVVGTVIDPATGEYLRNATIEVVASDGKRHATASGDGGAFRVTDLPPGTTQITVKFTGYTDETNTVDLSPGQTLNIDFSLDLIGKQGEAAVSDPNEIVVEAGILQGEARAIMAQRKSMDIIDVLPSESFGDITEDNVGEFIRFMPGTQIESEGDGTARQVRLHGLPAQYTGVTLNGVGLTGIDANNGSGGSRTFSFEQVSLSGLDSIETYWTTSADQDADHPGGIINLVTKRAYNRRKGLFSVQIGASTHDDLWDQTRNGPSPNGQTNRLLPNFKIDYADSFFGRRLGVAANLSFSDAYAEQEKITMSRGLSPTAASPFPMAVTAIEAFSSAQRSRRASAGLNLDFKASDRLSLSLIGSYNATDLWTQQNSYQFTTGARTAGVVAGGDPTEDFVTNLAATANSVVASPAYTSKRGHGLTLLPRIDWKSDHLVVDAVGFYSSSAAGYDPLGDKGNIDSIATTIAAKGNFSAVRSDDVMRQDWTIRQVSGVDWANPAAWTPSTLTIRTQDGKRSKVEYYGGQFDITLPHTFGADWLTIKTGFKYSKRVSDFWSDGGESQYRYVGSETIAQFLARVAESKQLSFADSGLSYAGIGASTHLYMPSTYLIGQDFLNNPNNWQSTLTAAQFYTGEIVNRRHFEEGIAAAYLMANGNIGRNLKLRAGLRWERTETAAREPDPLSSAEVTAAGYTVSASTGRASTIPGLQYQYFSKPMIYNRGSYDKFFPSASLKWTPGEHTDISLGYMRTIMRPEINVVAGVYTVDEINQIVTAPNAGLKPQEADNVQLRVARYFEPVGMIGVNAFQNNITGLWLTDQVTAEEFGNTDPRYAGYTFATTVNAPGGISRIRGLSFDWVYSFSRIRLLSGLVVRGSYTYLDTSVPMVGLAEHVVNGGVSYKTGPLAVKVAVSYNSGRPYSITSGARTFQRWNGTLSGTLALRKRWSLYFSARNLFNQPIIVTGPPVTNSAGTYPDPAQPYSAIYRSLGRVFSFGLRARF